MSNATFDADGITLEQVDEYVWEVPQEGGMRTPARVLASKALLEEIKEDKTLEQIKNTTHLPGITKHAICMPDGHQGYGFPVGGVGALDAEDGCISPGAVGYDINCGVRMMRTNLTYDELQGHEEELVDSLFANIPSGLGGGGVVEAGVDTVDEILARGVDWAVENGHAVEDDMRHCEDEGMREEADPSKVSQKAKDRGKNQIGSLGSGNHFLEVQRVTDIFDAEVGAAFGLEEDQIVVLIHCGSRGLGHQTCNDYLRKIEQQHQGLLNQLPDKELAAAPAGSQLAEDYYGAMNAAINFAWVNRQLIMHRTREVFERVFDRSWESMEMELLYDVAHNIAKKETHTIDDAGTERELYVHRKGATRAFPPGSQELPADLRPVGQPVLLPGSMGTASYVLVGEEPGDAFASCAHGAGRRMSRHAAKRSGQGGGRLRDDLAADGIEVRAGSLRDLPEEAPAAYKDVEEVVEVCEQAGLGRRVARLRPIGVVKG